MSSLITKGNASGTGSVTLESPNTNSDFTITVPAQTGTMITTASSGQIIPKAALPTGSVLQVVQGTTATASSTNSSSYSDTGLTASITPTSSTSKILVMAYCGMCTKSAVDTQLNLQIVRASTSVYLASAVNSNSSTADTSNPTLVYLDSPTTTSSTQYSVQFANRTAGTVFFNTNGTATITLLEIAA
jgi:hypothetical protein